MAALWRLDLKFYSNLKYYRKLSIRKPVDTSLGFKRLPIHR